MLDEISSTIAAVTIAFCVKFNSLNKAHMTRTNYKVYNEDKGFGRRYLDYQGKYLTQPRESDKVFLRRLDLLGNKVSESQQKPLRILDVGCSNGNLLRRIKDSFPQFDLVGIDLSADAIAGCKKMEELKGRGIQFFVGSALELSTMFKEEFDLVIANAMVHCLSLNEFKVAIEQFAHALKPAGQFWAFDGFHPFNQEIEIIERSTYCNQHGMPIYYRSYSGVSNVLQQIGFESVEFQPFEMPFDLHRPEDDFSTLGTHTVKTEDGTRLSMRGTLFQPWCHLFARKLKV